MATISFDKDFIIKDPKALSNLEKAIDNATNNAVGKHVPKTDIDKEIDEGVKKLKQSLSRSV